MNTFHYNRAWFPVTFHIEILPIRLLYTYNSVHLKQKQRRIGRNNSMIKTNVPVSDARGGLFHRHPVAF